MQFEVILKQSLFVLILILSFVGCRENARNHGNNFLTTDVFQPLDPGKTNVSGEIGRRIDITLRENIQKINTEKDFISPFLKKSNTDGFVGIGMYIDALAKIAAYTNDSQVIALKNSVIDQLISAQLDDGYIGLMQPPSRMWVLWDVHEMGYIIFGLMTNYTCFKDERSLQAAIKTADYILKHWSTMPQNWEKETKVNQHEAFTGLDRAMLTLYRYTGEQRFLDFCMNEKALSKWDLGIETGRRVGINGHVYGYIGMCLAQLELYRLSPDSDLLKQSGKVIDFLTAHDGMVISGEAGQWETWTDDQDGGDALGETCATAYQIRFYENLFRLTGESRYGDLMERAIYNGLFAAQSPDGRRIRYYTPMEGKREYFTDDTYCCPNNYRRIISEIPSMVYYKKSEGGICINLYTASSATIELSDSIDVHVIQETDYPNSGKINVTVSPSRPHTFPLRLRVPAWAQNVSVAVNGEVQNVRAVPGSLISIDRQWLAGDQVMLDIPLRFRLVKGRKRQAGRVALMRGPVLFCLNPEKNPGHGLGELTPDALGRILLDYPSLKGPFPDNTVRPDGMACRIGAWKPGFGMSDGPHDYELQLTEYPDPDCRSTYFNIADIEYSQEDELNQIFEKR